MTTPEDPQDGVHMVHAPPALNLDQVELSDMQLDDVSAGLMPDGTSQPAQIKRPPPPM